MLELDPEQRLLLTMETILDRNLAKYDLAIRDWGAHDPAAATVVRYVIKMRLEFVGKAFAELGFKGKELEMRTRLFVCYHTWEQATFGELTKKKRRELLRLRHRLLVEP